MARRRRFKRPEPREVVIETMSHEGRGIAHVNGKTVFVFGALAGEKVLMQVHQRNRKFDQATTLEVLEPAPERIEAKCAAFAVCGGCSLQHLRDSEQLRFKQQTLLEMMQHARLEVGEILEPLRAAAWGYRQKARLGVRYVPKKQRVLVGFRERTTPYIADMRRCEVLLPGLGERLDVVAEMLGSLEARAQIPQIEVAADDNAIQLVFRHLQPLSQHDLDILTEFAKSENFMLQLQPGGPASIHNLYPGEQRLAFDPIGDGKIRIPFRASDFVQVNTAINQQMVAQALSLLELEAQDQVLDLFCGLGNFTLPMATRCAAVTGVEGDAAMVQRAREAAGLNGIDNTRYHAADLSQPDTELPWMQRRYDKILLDPPRSGAQEMAAIIGRFDASRIVYVSCQPSSLVRDAGIICQQGYRIIQLGIMDMFPQTAHVESMAVFERIGGGQK